LLYLKKNYKVQKALLEESYVAQQAEDARAERERSTQNANVVIPAQMQNKKQLLMHKLKTRELAKGS
jgi:flotillin